MITNKAIEAQFKSDEIRTCCKLMMAKATEKERAVDPRDVLTQPELLNLQKTLLKELIYLVGDKVYLSIRGKIVANQSLVTLSRHP
ncbi:hypothetical protein ES707_15182 [subsurface metagenome]